MSTYKINSRISKAIFQSDKSIKFLEKYIKENNLMKNFSNVLKIDTGFRCNAKCSYCYYLSKVNDDFIDSEKVYEQINNIEVLNKNGFNINKIEFSGGESTIHPDFIKWIRYAKEKNLITSVITNGCFNIEDLYEYNKAGLDEIMFSIHGYNKNHNNIVKIENAYQTIFEKTNLINNSNINIKIRFNIIINKYINDLNNIITDVLLTKPKQINFLPINEWDDAHYIGKRTQKIVHERISIIEENIERICEDIGESNISTPIDFNLRYFEYCKINEKYHKYIYNYLDQFFTCDWNPFFIYKDDVKNFLKDNLYSTDDELIQVISKNIINKRNSQYFKNKKCIDCKFEKICDGFKKN